MSVDKLRDMKIAIRDTRTTEDGKRTKFIKNSTGRQTKATFRSAKQNQSNYNSLDNQIKNLIQFKFNDENEFFDSSNLVITKIGV